MKRNCGYRSRGPNDHPRCVAGAAVTEVPSISRRPILALPHRTPPVFSRTRACFISTTSLAGTRRRLERRASHVPDKELLHRLLSDALGHNSSFGSRSASPCRWSARRIRLMPNAPLRLFLALLLRGIRSFRRSGSRYPKRMLDSRGTPSGVSLVGQHDRNDMTIRRPRKTSA